MVFVSITRLRLRSSIYLIPFFWYAFRSGNQIIKASGFIKGKTLLDKKLTFLTMSLWTGDAEMRQYRNTDEHKNAMPKLQYWCCEASVVHWVQEGQEFPKWQEAHQRMKIAGRLSKVKYPSVQNSLEQIPVPGNSSKPERILLPKHN